MTAVSIASRTVLLARMLLGGSQSFAQANSSQKLTPAKKVLRIVGFAVLILYLMGIAAFMIYGATSVLVPLGLGSLVAPALTTFYGLLVIILGFYYVISIFYYSSDAPVLLALPFRPVEIAGARFIQSYIYIFLSGSLFFLPGFIAYGVAAGLGVSYYLMIPVLITFLPLIPLSMITMLVMLLMRVAPFARNKDRFSMIMNLVMMAIVLSLSFYLSTPTSEEELIAILLGGADGSRLESITRLNMIFPGISWAGRAVVNADTAAGWGWLGLFVLACLAAVTILILVATPLYGRTIVNFTTGGQKRRILAADELKRGSRRQPVLKSLMLKEMRILVRTPVFFLNNILSGLIIPVMVLASPLIYGEALPVDRASLAAQFSSWASRPIGEESIGILIALIGTAAYGLGFGSMNSITATALSREGTSAYVMKYLPVSYTVQLLAKFIPGLVLGAGGGLVVLIPMAWYFAMPISLTVLLVLYMVLGSAVSCLLGLFFDVLSPKLKWDNETQAVKNNMNVLWAMLLGMLLAGLMVLMGLGAWQLSLPMPVLAIGLLLVLAALCAALAVWIQNWLPKRMRKLDL